MCKTKRICFRMNFNVYFEKKEGSNLLQMYINLLEFCNFEFFPGLKRYHNLIITCIMSLRIYLATLILFSFFNAFAQQEKTYKIQTIAFYNLENLFDYEDDPITFDDDRTPEGKDHWSHRCRRT